MSTKRQRSETVTTSSGQQPSSVAMASERAPAVQERRQAAATKVPNETSQGHGLPSPGTVALIGGEQPLRVLAQLDEQLLRVPAQLDELRLRVLAEERQIAECAARIATYRDKIADLEADQTLREWERKLARPAAAAAAAAATSSTSDSKLSAASGGGESGDKGAPGDHVLLVAASSSRVGARMLRALAERRPLFAGRPDMVVRRPGDALRHMTHLERTDRDGVDEAEWGGTDFVGDHGCPCPLGRRCVAGWAYEGAPLASADLKPRVVCGTSVCYHGHEHEEVDAVGEIAEWEIGHYVLDDWVVVASERTWNKLTLAVDQLREKRARGGNDGDSDSDGDD